MPLSSAQLALLPCALLLAGFALGLGRIVTIVQAHYRDTEHLLGLTLSVWFWLTPIAYTRELVPVHLDPDILLVDEVIAVGDRLFQERCVLQIREMRAAGKAVVLATHDLAQARALAESAMVLHEGRVVASGDADWVIDEFLSASAGRSGEVPLLESAPRPPIPRSLPADR